MAYVVDFDAQARADLADLYDYLLGEAGETVATSYIEKLLDYCAGFETFPERGTARNEIYQGLRFVGYRRKATIAFRVKGNAVTIVRIFHGGKHVVVSLPEPGEID